MKNSKRHWTDVIRTPVGANGDESRSWGVVRFLDSDVIVGGLSREEAERLADEQEEDMAD